MAGSDTQRLFIALPCPRTPPIDSVLDELRAAQREEKSGLRCVAPDTLHITLKFLGAVRPELDAPIKQAMDATLGALHGFTLELRGAGSFHGALWLGVAPHPLLAELAERCAAALQALGFAPEDKAFRPHVTVARLGRNPTFDRRTWARRLAGTAWGTLEARAVHLYKSETRPDGARYSVIHTTRLG